MWPQHAKPVSLKTNTARSSHSAAIPSREWTVGLRVVLEDDYLLIVPDGLPMGENEETAKLRVLIVEALNLGNEGPPRSDEAIIYITPFVWRLMVTACEKGLRDSSQSPAIHRYTRDLLQRLRELELSMKITEVLRSEEPT